MRKPCFIVHIIYSYLCLITLCGKQNAEAISLYTLFIHIYMSNNHLRKAESGSHFIVHIIYLYLSLLTLCRKQKPFHCTHHLFIFVSNKSLRKAECGSRFIVHTIYSYLCLITICGKRNAEAVSLYTLFKRKTEAMIYLYFCLIT